MPTDAPEKEKQKQTTLQQVRDVLLAVAAVITALSVPLQIILSHRNTESVEKKLDEKATEVLDKQDDTLKKQDKAATVAKEVKETLDETLGPQLYSTMIYLQDQADWTKDPKDIQKAAEAKKAFEVFRARQPKKTS